MMDVGRSLSSKKLGKYKMRMNKYDIEGIPSVEWGEKQDRVFIAVHGNMSHKEDTVIQILAQVAVEKGYQVLSFDLPQHGDRKEKEPLCKVQYCVKDLQAIMRYAKQNWRTVRLFACSMGAYSSVLAYKDDALEQCLFLSPVVDMKLLIDQMMVFFNFTPERLQREQEIATPIGHVLYWDYYCYVNDHPIDRWNVPTAILFGGKDEVSDFSTVDAFVKRFKCHLDVEINSEHYFHTDEQLTAYKNWLSRHIE